jgi:tellurite resistance protein TerC
MGTSIYFWGAFLGFVLLMLALDLGVFHRKAHEVKMKEAGIWTIVWIVLAFLFAGAVYHFKGAGPAMEFVAGYLIEEALSVDNLFVFLVLFSYFKVPPVYQHRILFWGILGALIMRASLILIGAALIAKFHWVLYVFGGFLVFTAIKLAVSKEEGSDPGNNPVVRAVRRFVPLTNEFSGSRFFVKIDGKKLATPLFLVLVTVEFTDLVFALDSIPAIFSVTTDTFIIYTSNVFAILGLRSLYFALAGIMDMFHYLKIGLSVILGFVGVKMLIVDYYKIPIGISLAVVGGLLALSVLASILWPKREAVSTPPVPVPLPSSQEENRPS